MQNINPEEITLLYLPSFVWSFQKHSLVHVFWDCLLVSYLLWSIIQKLRQDKCWNAWRHYLSSYSINKQCRSQHISSVFAASPGRVNSLLQKLFSANSHPLRGNESQELVLGTCERSHTLLTALTAVLACLAGHWQWLAALFLLKQFEKQIFKPVPAADPTSFACYPEESETSAACRESSLFTEEIFSCAHPRSINGHLWEYWDN